MIARLFKNCLHILCSPQVSHHIHRVCHWTRIYSAHAHTHTHTQYTCTHKVHMHTHTVHMHTQSAHAHAQCTCTHTVHMHTHTVYMHTRTVHMHTHSAHVHTQCTCTHTAQAHTHYVPSALKSFSSNIPLALPSSSFFILSHFEQYSVKLLIKQTSQSSETQGYSKWLSGF